jgi:PPOX class probable F420-dependent enzyme
MTTLTDFAALVPEDHGLVTVSTTRADGTIQVSVVNAGVLDHPVTGEPVVAFVARSGTRKLTNLAARPACSVVIRAGWQWVGVEGTASVIGPDDVGPEVGLPALLRAVFTAAGGSHEDWDEFDRVMREERRAAVFVAPTRIYSNG